MTTAPKIIDKIHTFRDEGRSKLSVAKELKLDYGTVRKWWNQNAPVIQSAEIVDLKSIQCGFESHPGYQSYSYILGLYLGDGYINKQGPTYKLRIAQDLKYPLLIEHIKSQLKELFQNNKINSTKFSNANAAVIYVHNNEIVNLFPQHGPGAKHTRTITLQPWQEHIINLFPFEFLKGLIHSDGSRYIHRVGKAKHAYVKYNFTNRSEDIVKILVWACSLVNLNPTIHCRPSGKYIVTFNKRGDVEVLERYIGPKQ